MRWVALALVLASAGGCAVGPDFQQPAAPATNRYVAESLPPETASSEGVAGAAQRFAEGKGLAAEWWTLFRSEPLNDLIKAALTANPDLQAAEAALRVARENVLAQQGAYFPTVEAQFNPTRQSTAPTLASPLAENSYLFSLHTAQLSVSYVPDVFGLNKRQVESLSAQAEAQQFTREAAYLTLTSNIVVAAIQEASLRAQQEATQRIISIANEQLEMMRRQQAVGQIGAADVALQETALAQAQAALPPLEKQLAQQRHLLSVLAGRFPSEELSQRFELAALELPEELPVSLPSRLVEQRPDIRAAEAQLHSASAQIGVATANRLPNITLTASGGSAALEFAKLFSPGTWFWSVGASIAQTLFDGGTLLHKQRAAEAAYDQASAQYRSTVLTAFQNVADTLTAIQSDASALRAAAAAERGATKSLMIARQQWKTGAAGYLTVLAAEQTYQQAAITLVQARANRFSDTAALFQALGGGWWNRAEASSASY
ncbi:MAG TPA: efflux transporter outer membrane subunit [Casimicrobiaceae bacterium]|nr:efflux transporter outer membrane subunit [Casimicrobiaceae bacterium]